MNDEWVLLLERVSKGTPTDFNRGVRWVLVNIFGGNDPEEAVREYHYDPLFHAQVDTAGQMIERLADLHRLNMDRRREEHRG